MCDGKRAGSGWLPKELFGVRECAGAKQFGRAESYGGAKWRPPPVEMNANHVSEAPKTNAP